MPINIPEPPQIPGQPPLPQAGPVRTHGEPAGPGPAVRSVPEGRWYGVYPALVRENRDPDGLGRVRVLLPWAADAGGTGGGQKAQRYEAWARLATMMAGSNRGSWFLPELDDEVLVAFEAGDPSRPVVVGALWNGQDGPPVTADAGNSVKVLRTRSGSEIRFDDPAGSEAIEIRTGAGQSIRLTVTSGGAIRVTDGGGNAVTLEPTGIRLEAATSVHVQANAISLQAAVVRIQSPVVNCDGTIQGTTLIVQNVVASSYTPGAGNIS